MRPQRATQPHPRRSMSLEIFLHAGNRHRIGWHAQEYHDYKYLRKGAEIKKSARRFQCPNRRGFEKRTFEARYRPVADTTIGMAQPRPALATARRSGSAS